MRSGVAVLAALCLCQLKYHLQVGPVTVRIASSQNIQSGGKWLPRTRLGMALDAGPLQRQGQMLLEQVGRWLVSGKGG